MLRQKSSTTDSPAAAAAVAPAALVSGEDAQARAFKAIAELTASPEFQSLGDSFPEDFATAPSAAASSSRDFANEPLFDNEDPPIYPSDAPLFSDDSPFLTSPMDSMLGDEFTSPMDTPYSEFMPTPLLSMHDTFDLESPLITDRADVGEFSGSLFGGDFPAFDDPAAKAPAPVPAVNLEGLWQISPSTPMLDSPPTPALPSASPAPAPAPAAVARPVVPPPPATRRRTGATGTRKNITPAALIPLDAPTQRRTYLTASATSRKAVPAGFKRSHAAAFGGGDDDDDDDEVLSPTASEKETIEYKRRQNTLAARKSRKRKLEHTQMLEQTVDALKSEVTMWRERALLAQDMLRGAGIKFAFSETEQ